MFFEGKTLWLYWWMDNFEKMLWNSAKVLERSKVIETFPVACQYYLSQMILAREFFDLPKLGHVIQLRDCLMLKSVFGTAFGMSPCLTLTHVFVSVKGLPMIFALPLNVFYTSYTFLWISLISEEINFNIDYATITLFSNNLIKINKSIESMVLVYPISLS